MKREIKTTLALDGEKKFKEGMADASRQLKVLNSEMKANKASFQGNEQSLEALTSKGKLFEKQVAQQKEIVGALARAVEESSQKYGEADRKTDGYKIQLNNATAALAKMERNLEQNRAAIADQSAETEQATTKLGKLKQKAAEMGSDFQGMGEKFKSFGTTMSGVSAAILGSFVAVTQGTKEFRRDLSRLEVNAQTAGQNMGVVSSAMARLQAITGETDSSVEGLSNLLATGFRDEELTQLLDSLYGAAIRFSDTLKFEGIADGLQETLATGAAIGPFAELLDRSGVSLDKFNEGLKKAIANGTEENYILQALADTGLAGSYEAWRKNNEEMVKAEEATYRMQEALAKLGGTLEPILTPIIEKTTELVGGFNALDPTIQKAILVVGGLTAAIGPVSLAIAGLGTALTFLGTGPVGLVIAALVGATAAVVSFGDSNKGADKAVSTVWSNIVSNIKKRVSEAVAHIKWLSDLINAVKRAWGAITDKPAAVGDFRQLEESSKSAYKETNTSFKGITANIANLGGATKKATKAAEKSKTVWIGTAEAIKTSLATLKSRHESELVYAEMAGNEVAALKLKHNQLTKELNTQKEVVSATTKELEKATRAGVKQGENKHDLAKRIAELNQKLTDEQKNQATLEKQVYETNKSLVAQNKAIQKQSQDFQNMADEVTKVQNKMYSDLAEAADGYRQKVEAVNSKLIDDEKRVTEQYENELNNRTKALANFVGLFDEVTKDEVSGTTLLSNLQGQVDTFDKWQSDIAALAAKGLDQGFMAELEGIGPDASDEVAALLTLTDDQLEEYVNLWQQKQQMAREQAIQELELQRQEMQYKLMEIRADAEEQLARYEEEWKKKNATIRANAEEELKKIEDKFRSLAENSTDYGQQFVLGFVGGMESRFDELREAAAEMAAIVASGVTEPLDIRSPSKLMAKYGRDTAQGFSDGISSKLKELEKTAFGIVQKVTPDISASGNSGVGGRVVNNNNVFHITVQDGEDLLRTLRRLGVAIP